MGKRERMGGHEAEFVQRALNAIIKGSNLILQAVVTKGQPNLKLLSF